MKVEKIGDTLWRVTDPSQGVSLTCGIVTEGDRWFYRMHTAPPFSARLYVWRMGYPGVYVSDWLDALTECARILSQ